MFKWMLKKILQRCFKQGNNGERRMLYETIMETIANVYKEDNCYTHWYWVLEEILFADSRFNHDTDIECVKKGVVKAVADAKEMIDLGYVEK